MYKMARIMKLIPLMLVLTILMAACAASEDGKKPSATLATSVIDVSAEATSEPASQATPEAVVQATSEAVVQETPEAFAEATPELTEEPIIVDELIDVEDLMINQELDDDGWWNILLLGSDSRNMDNYYGLTDSIVILSVHPESGQAKLTSVMRDTWVDIYGVGKRKINSANVYGGPDLILRTVNEYFGMNLTDYVLVSMEALADIIDTIGGIDIAVTKNEMGAINHQLKWDAMDFKLNDSTALSVYGESVHLTGNQALAFARIRSLDSDYVRTERQRTVLIAIADKLQATDAKTISAVVLRLAGYVQTNLSIAQMTSLATVGLSIDMGEIEQLRLPADGTFESDTYDGVWSIRADFDANRQILHDFIYGAQ